MFAKFGKGEKGFTLIELMIVVAIIGILAAIAIPQFSQYRQRGFNAAMQSDLRNAATAMETIYTDSNTYAAVLNDLTARGFVPSANITVAPAGNSATYSLQATHASGASTWSLTGPGGAVSSP